MDFNVLRESELRWFGDLESEDSVGMACLISVYLVPTTQAEDVCQPLLTGHLIFLRALLALDGRAPPTV